MAITVQCPGCGKKGAVPEAFQGKSVKCPGCGQQFGVAASSASAETKTGAQTVVPRPAAAPQSAAAKAKTPPPKPATAGSAPGTAPAAPPVTSGQKVGAGYQLLQRIGKGAYGEVWKAEAPGGVAVALKVLNVPPDHKEAKNELAAQEIVKKLRHPFLLQTQAYWVKDNRLFIAMELADGSLRDRLKQMQKQGGDIPFDELLRCFRESAEALDWLHEQGVLHQDVKPENILLLTGHAKVADMGLARKQFETKTSMVGSGTPSYMAPEAWEGKASPLSDQYSLAASYAEMRRHKLIFTGPNLHVIKRAHIEQQPDLTGLSAAEQEVLLRALSKNPKERFPSCKAFVEALEQAMPRELKRPAAAGAAPAKKLPGPAEHAPAPAASGPILDVPDDVGLVKLSAGGGSEIEVGEEIIVVEEDEPSPTTFTPGGPKAKVLDSSGREETDEPEPPKKPAAAAAVLVDAQCPGCGHSGRVPEKFIGKKIKCRECAQAFFVVDTREPEEKPAPAAKKTAAVQAAPPPPPVDSSPFGDLTADAGPGEGGLVRLSRERDRESSGGGGNTGILIGSGIGLIVMVGMAIAIIASRSGGDKEPDTQPQAKGKVDRTEKTDIGTPATEVMSKDPPATKTKDPPIKPKGAEWVDAAADMASLGPVRVKVAAVEIDYVFGKKADDISKDKQLLIRLEVHNRRADTGRVEYVGWGAELPSDGTPAASLRDDQGAPSKRILYDTPGLIEGQVVKEEFTPGVVVKDLLIFEVPKAGWKALYLELPARNFGQTGELKFRIPDTLLGSNIPVENEPPPELTPAEEKNVLAQRKLLKDKNPLVRMKAADALRNLGPKAFSAASDLGKALQDQNEKIRVTAAQALSSMGPLARPAIPDLIGALKDEFWKVQGEAARALGNIGPPCQDALPKLKELLKSKDEDVPNLAREAISKIMTRPKK